MKRFFAFAGLMTAAAISLTNCQPKEISFENLPADGKSFRVSASTVITKTTNDGMKTLWEAVDTMNIFYRTPETADFVNLGKATVLSGDGTVSAVFGGEIPATVGLPAGDATWYAIFPYNPNIEAPNGRTGYNYIGHSRGINQGDLGSTAHLRGNVCPMYAVAEGNGPTVSLAMKHLTSVIELNIKNETSSEIAVSSISYEASEDIVGSYYFDLTGDVVGYIPSGDNYVYKKAVVNIKGENNTIAAGATGLAYLPIKPYTQAASTPIKVIVNYSADGKASSCAVELNPSGAQCAFVAGKVKRVHVSVTPEPVEPGVTVVSTMMADYVKDHQCTVSTQSEKTVYSHLELSDAVRLYTNGQPDCGTFWSPASGTEWRLYQNKSGDVTVQVASGCTLKSVKFTYNSQNTGVLLTSSSEQLASDDVFECSGNEVTFTVGNSTDGTTNGQARITAVEVKYTGSGKLDEWVDPVEASLSVDPTAINFPATGGQPVVVTVTVAGGDWSFDSQNLPDWVFAFADKSKGTISISAGDNVGAARSYDFVVSHSNGTLTKTVKINQAAAATPAGDHTFVFNSADGLSALGITVPNASDATSLSGGTYTSKDGISISFDKGTASTDTRIWCTNTGALDLRAYNGSSMTISAPSGYSVTKVTFSGADVSTLSNLTEGAWSGKASAIEFLLSGTAKIDYIDVETASGTSDPIVAAKLAVDPSVLSFDVEGGSLNVIVSSDNNNWSVQSDASWLSVSKSAAFAGFVATAGANTGDIRSATVTVTHSNGELTATVSVTQAKPASGNQTVISVDFTAAIDGFPQGSDNGAQDGTYTLSSYSFVFHAANKFYQTKGSGSGATETYFLLIGKANSYIQLPVVSGKALVGVKFLTGASASENVIIDIAKADESSTRLNINEAKIKKGTEYNWGVTGAKDTAYRILVTNAYNAQFQTLTLTYE